MNRACPRGIGFDLESARLCVSAGAGSAAALRRIPVEVLGMTWHRSPRTGRLEGHWGREAAPSVSRAGL